MNELQLQRLVVQSVKEAGGFGFKLSNRFLIGIPDLLILLPNGVTSIWEVKVQDQPKVAKDVKIALTPLQAKFLREFEGIGGRCGVVSFIRGKADLLMGISNYSGLGADLRMKIRDHKPVRRGRREADIMAILKGDYGRES